MFIHVHFVHLQRAHALKIFSLKKKKKEKNKNDLFIVSFKFLQLWSLISWRTNFLNRSKNERFRGDVVAFERDTGVFNWTRQIPAARDGIIIMRRWNNNYTSERAFFTSQPIPNVAEPSLNERGVCNSGLTGTSLSTVSIDPSGYEITT